MITYSGTLVHGASGDYISAHTVEANVGIYTQPEHAARATWRSASSASAARTRTRPRVSGVAQEAQDRIFLEAETTDVKTPVDIYMMDVDPRDGTVRNRWITPFEMTGENQAGNPSGGITTQFTGAQPQRARLRATKAPTGLLSQPTRNIRVVAALALRAAAAARPAGARRLPGERAEGRQRPRRRPVLRADVRVHLPRERHGRATASSRSTSGTCRSCATARAGRPRPASGRSSRRRGVRRSPTCRRCRTRRRRPRARPPPLRPPPRRPSRPPRPDRPPPSPRLRPRPPPRPRRRRSR